MNQTTSPHTHTREQPDTSCHKILAFITSHNATIALQAIANTSYYPLANLAKDALKDIPTTPPPPLAHGDNDPPQAPTGTG